MGERWAFNLPNGSCATVGRGVIQVRDYTGALVIYRPRLMGALFIGPLNVQGRRIEVRS